MCLFTAKFECKSSHNFLDILGNTITYPSSDLSRNAKYKNVLKIWMHFNI